MQRCWEGQIKTKNNDAQVKCWSMIKLWIIYNELFVVHYWWKARIKTHQGTLTIYINLHQFKFLMFFFFCSPNLYRYIKFHSDFNHTTFSAPAYCTSALVSQWSRKAMYDAQLGQGEFIIIVWNMNDFLPRSKQEKAVVLDITEACVFAD